MIPLRINLRLAEAKLADAMAQLELAHHRATQLAVAPNYIAAIDKSIDETRDAWLHTGNIATVIQPSDDPLN
ncbi:hypothetical protein ES708_23732 [subsurface metagenome]